MTEQLFTDDAYARSCESRVAAHIEGGVVLESTVFYPLGGGQPGDTGVMKAAGGAELRIANTIKNQDQIVHVLEDGATMPDMGSLVTVELDWDRRYAHMRMHTCLHLLCSLIDGGVTGGSIGAEKSRLDFDLQDTALDKEQITADLNKLIEADHSLTSDWISDDDMASRPELVRTMSVKPPVGKGRVRLINVDGVDLQPCGGTHVRSTSEIGRVKIGKIENKGKHNRRVNVLFD